MILGLLLALASAVGTNVAFLFKHRGAVLAPAIRVRHPLRGATDLFSSRWFAVGWLVAILAWGLHVGALSLAPLSIVQAVLSGGLGFLAVAAERYFGFQLGRRQWAGVTITAAGLVMIGLTAAARPIGSVPRWPPWSPSMIDRRRSRCGGAAWGAMLGVARDGLPRSCGTVRVPLASDPGCAGHNPGRLPSSV
jgi:drug/metabolite transporter (DMT)-like permease